MSFECVEQADGSTGGVDKSERLTMIESLVSG